MMTIISLLHLEFEETIGLIINKPYFLQELTSNGNQLFINLKTMLFTEETLRLEQLQVIIINLLFSEQQEIYRVN